MGWLADATLLSEKAAKGLAVAALNGSLYGMVAVAAKSSQGPPEGFLWAAMGSAVSVTALFVGLKRKDVDKFNEMVKKNKDEG